MFASCPHSRLQRVCVAIAALFGIVTIVAGGRVLPGLHAIDRHDVDGFLH